jgi:hypothetical protein
MSSSGGRPRPPCRTPQPQALEATPEAALPDAEAAGRLTLVAVGLAEHRLDQLALVRLEAMVEGTLRVIGAEVISKGVITGTPELRRKISGSQDRVPGEGRRSAR